jgi:hypothetical protein
MILTFRAATILAAMAWSLPAQGTTDASALKETRSKAIAAFQEQRFDDAIPLLRKVLAASPDDGQCWYHLGFALHSQQKLDEALQAHLKATSSPRYKPTATYNVACVYALKNDKDKAFEWLQKALEAGFAQVDHMAIDSDMDSLRDDPRYKAITEKMAKAERPDTIQAFAQASSARDSTRIAYFGRRTSAGQLVIDYGTPKWKDEYAAHIANKMFDGRRWRLGNDMWTSLDSSLGFELGDQKFEPGQYYLVIERKSDGKIVLVVLDPAEVRKQKLDAYLAHMTTGGTDVALKHEESKEVEQRLRITLSVDDGDHTRGELSIAFGPHRLSAPVKLKL